MGSASHRGTGEKFSVAVILNFTLKPQHNITIYGISCMEFKLGEGQNKVHFPNYATVYPTMPQFRLILLLMLLLLGYVIA